MGWITAVLFFCGLTMVRCIPVLLPANDTDALEFSGNPNLGKEEYLRLLYSEDNYLLFGGRNYLYNVSSTTMELNKKHEWQNQRDEGLLCGSTFLEAYAGDCYNYIMSASKVSDTRFIICADVGVASLCKVMLQTEENGWELTDTNAASDVTEDFGLPSFYAPPWHWIRHFKHTTSEGVKYFMTMRLGYGDSTTPYFQIGRSPSSSGRALITPTSNEIFAIDNNERDLRPTYSGVFDANEHVYFLYSEPAIETFHTLDTERGQYSRIARVCKNDKGDSPSAFRFSSFFKTRLLCGPKSLSPSAVLKPSEGYYPSYLNVVEDNSQPHISSIRGANGEKIILALFSHPRGMAKGSAICAYKVSDIEETFTNNKVVNGTGTVDNVQDPTKCVENTHNMTAQEKEIRKLYRLANPVRAINDDALFLIEGFKMTRIFVDWQVEAADGKKYDVIFASTDDGRLLKLVKFSKSANEEEKYHMVEEREIFPGQPIEELRLIQDEWGKKHLIVGTHGDAKRVALEKCHRYEGCEACIGLRDPYCGWSQSLDRCVSTSHEANDKVADIATGVHSSCMKETSFTTKSDDREELPTTDSTIEVEIPDNGSGRTGSVKSELKEANTPLIVVAVILPIVFGMLAFVAGYYYAKRQYQSKTPHIDEQLKTKDSTDTLKSQQHDYNLPPSKPTNLQYTNNLHSGNFISNPETMGEATLQRHKKSYV